jgi:hypothetical protein
MGCFSAHAPDELSAVTRSEGFGSVVHAVAYVAGGNSQKATRIIVHQTGAGMLTAVITSVMGPTGTLSELGH